MQNLHFKNVGKFVETLKTAFLRVTLKAFGIFGFNGKYSSK